MEREEGEMIKGKTWLMFQMSKTKEPRRKKNRNDEGNRDDYHILKNEVWNILFF